MSRRERRVESYHIDAPEFPSVQINEAVVRFQQERQHAGNPLSRPDADRLRLGLAFLTSDKMTIETAARSFGMPTGLARSRFKLPCETDALARCLSFFEKAKAGNQQQKGVPDPRTDRVIQKRASPQGRRYGPVTRPMESGIIPQVTETDKDKLVIALFAEATGKRKPSFADVAAALNQQAGDIKPLTPADIQQAKRRVYRLEKYGDIHPHTKKRAHLKPGKTTRDKVNDVISKLEKNGQPVNPARIAKNLKVTPARVRQLIAERAEKRSGDIFPAD